MNETIRKIIICIVVCITCFSTGFILSNRISEAGYNKSIIGLSKSIADSKVINDNLTRTNKELGKLNIQFETRIGELEQRISEDSSRFTKLQQQLSDSNKRNQELINGISIAIGTIENGLGESGDIIQEVIGRIDKIKLLIQQLKSN